MITPLKRDFLKAWFAEEQRFFLTGGSALGLFYYPYRISYDLDLFTTEPIEGLSLRNQVRRVAESIGALCEGVQSSPDFYRFQLRRGAELEKLDFVVDRAPQLDDQKAEIGGIKVDTLREIIANKWTAFLGRAELKDLIDLYFLEKNGHEILKHLDDAKEKDAGLEAAMLSLLLGSVQVEEVPGYLVDPFDLGDFRDFVSHIRKQLAELALPESRSSEKGDG